MGVVCQFSGPREVNAGAVVAGPEIDETTGEQTVDKDDGEDEQTRARRAPLRALGNLVEPHAKAGGLQDAIHNAKLNGRVHVLLACRPEAPDKQSDDTAQAERQKMAFDGLDAMLRLARESGAKIALGTDFVGSSETKATQLEELQIRTSWFSNAEILRQATGLNGQLWDLAGPRNPYQAGPVGVTQSGAYADILLVNGDPIADLKVMATADNFDVIMKGGKIYKNSIK